MLVQIDSHCAVLDNKIRKRNMTLHRQSTKERSRIPIPFTWFVSLVSSYHGIKSQRLCLDRGFEEGFGEGKGKANKILKQQTISFPYHVPFP